MLPQSKKVTVTCSSKDKGAVARKACSTACIGCGMCAKNCPANCIVGEKKSRHVIEQNKCLKCGQCEKTCKFGAIIKK